MKVRARSENRRMKEEGIYKLGNESGCDTHDPIPNSIVKPSSADDTSAKAGGKVGRCRA